MRAANKNSGKLGNLCLQTASTKAGGIEQLALSAQALGTSRVVATSGVSGAVFAGSGVAAAAVTFAALGRAVALGSAADVAAGGGAPPQPPSKPTIPNPKVASRRLNI
jgi:hypothetical protein